MKKTIVPQLGKNVEPLEKIHFFLIWFVRISVTIAFIPLLANGNWLTLFTSILILFLTFTPAILEKKYKIDFPIEFEIVAVLLIYGSVFLGELNDYYAKIWWWDLLLHGMTGLTMGLIGFMVLFILYSGKKITAAPKVIALFSFSLAAAIGGIWEIFEFSMDQLFGLNMQKSGLVDTMGDLIINNAGALIASIAGYFYLSKGNVPILTRIVKRFKKENPKLIKSNAS